jgi:hypothetical protein
VQPAGGIDLGALDQLVWRDPVSGTSSSEAPFEGIIRLRLLRMQ